MTGSQYHQTTRLLRRQEFLLRCYYYHCFWSADSITPSIGEVSSNLFDMFFQEMIFFLFLYIESLPYLFLYRLNMHGKFLKMSLSFDFIVVISVIKGKPTILLHFSGKKMKNFCKYFWILRSTIP